MHQFAFGFALFAFGAGYTASADDKKEPPAEAVKEESVVAYDSKTLGAVEVKTLTEKTKDWFAVEQNGKRVTSSTTPPRLNTTIELMPGAYVVLVNRTEHKVTIEAGKKTVLWTGELMVTGKKDSGDFYAPFQGKVKKLAGVEPLVNVPISLFAGKYMVKVFMGAKTKEVGEAEVKVGQRTQLQE
jgi:hypothetical protein